MRKRSPLPIKGKPRFCLGEGSCPSSLGVPFTTMTVTGLLLCLPPRPAVCSSVQTWPQRPTPLPGHPASTSPSLDKASFLQIPLLLTTPCAVCLGHLLSCFCLQRQVLGKGNLGAGDSERQRAQGGGERRPAAGLCPGRGGHRECVLAGGGRPLPGARL